MAIIPTALVFAFLSYDDGFLKILDGIFSYNPDNTPQWFMSVFFSVPLAMYGYGLYTSSRRDILQDKITAENCDKIHKKVRILPQITAVVATFPIIFLYVIFFISQWKYFISGYGEPTFRLPEAREVALRIKDRVKGIRIRINTNGQSDLILGYNTAPLYKDAFDTVSVSLNSPTAEGYDAVCHSDFGPAAFDGILSFVKAVKEYVPDTRLSVVSEFISDSEIERCREIADELGVSLRVREYIS